MVLDTPNGVPLLHLRDSVQTRTHGRLILLQVLHMLPALYLTLPALPLVHGALLPPESVHKKTVL